MTLRAAARGVVVPGTLTSPSLSADLLPVQGMKVYYFFFCRLWLRCIWCTRSAAKILMYTYWAFGFFMFIKGEKPASSEEGFNLKNLETNPQLKDRRRFA